MRRINNSFFHTRIVLLYLSCPGMVSPILTGSQSIPKAATIYHLEWCLGQANWSALWTVKLLRQERFSGGLILKLIMYCWAPSAWVFLLIKRCKYPILKPTALASNYGHTHQKALDPVWSPKLSWWWRSQYCAGGHHGNTVCCSFCRCSCAWLQIWAGRGNCAWLQE